MGGGGSAGAPHTQRAFHGAVFGSQVGWIVQTMDKKVVRYDWAEMGFCRCVMSRQHMRNLITKWEGL